MKQLLKKIFFRYMFGTQLFVNLVKNLVHEGLEDNWHARRKIKSNDLNVRVPHSGWNNLILKKIHCLKINQMNSLFILPYSFGIFLQINIPRNCNMFSGENFSYY